MVEPDDGIVHPFAYAVETRADEWARDPAYAVSIGRRTAAGRPTPANELYDPEP